MSHSNYRGPQPPSSYYQEIGYPVVRGGGSGGGSGGGGSGGNQRDYVQVERRGRRANNRQSRNSTSRGDHPAFRTNEIIKLNVGGRQFTTSKSTLVWINDTFFTGELSGNFWIDTLAKSHEAWYY